MKHRSWRGSGEHSHAHRHERIAAQGYYLSGDNAPRGYGTATVSLFGGPTTAGAADQGGLAYGDGTTSVNVATGADTSDHTTTGTPVSVRRLYHESFGGGEFTWDTSGPHEVEPVTTSAWRLAHLTLVSRRRTRPRRCGARPAAGHDGAA